MRIENPRTYKHTASAEKKTKREERRQHAMLLLYGDWTILAINVMRESYMHEVGNKQQVTAFFWVAA